MTTGYDAGQKEYLIEMLKTSPLAVFIIFGNIIIAPVLEEILFRGILQSNFLKK
ncbi:type II CAAX prenyl endopeptidase Rce1 family protein [Lactobacillus bombicola]|uniref:CPBP family glutamic-type intramembrane protease n=1 Tax=Lactobacillus bombicola TaxID=1505723 RepID=UPI000A488E62|nr:CPBP family glutamic-type intramembrane protease [Lactobacillus bombicola]